MLFLSVFRLIVAMGELLLLFLFVSKFFFLVDVILCVDVCLDVVLVLEVLDEFFLEDRTDLLGQVH